MKIGKHPYRAYTVCFAGLVLVLYGIFMLTGKSFIWQGDGLAQHYPILVKFYEWLHQGSLTGWDWSLGLGADKVTTFSYYVLGDPFAYLIWFFPKAHLEMGYNLLVLVRLYFSGLALMLFARQRHFKPGSQLFGTLVYTFTGFSLYVSIRHPFFLLPMILFPLLAYGIDHVYRGKSWLPLAGFTALALVGNFYFAYILAIGSLVYAVLRYLAVRKTVVVPFRSLLGRLFGAGVVGFLLAGVLFIPSVWGVLQSTRATGHFANGYLLYPFSYYLRLSNAVLTTGNPMSFWVNLGLTGLTFLSVVYTLRHFRQYRWLNIGMLPLIGGTLLPAVAAVMNGGTTPSQRWLLLGNLAFSLAVMTFVDHLTDLTHRDLVTLLWASLGLLGAVWVSNGFIYQNRPHDFVLYGLLLLTLLLILAARVAHWSRRQTLLGLLGLLSLNIVANGYGYFSPNAGGASQQLTPRGVATKFQQTYYDGAQKYVRRQPGFSRSVLSNQYYYSNEAKTNLGMNLGTHDIMSYFSIENGAVGDFSQAVGNSQFKMNKPINQADSRTTLSNLLGVRYLFARTNQRGKQALPYGYRVVKRRNGNVLTYRDQPVHSFGNNYGTILYQSKNALPLAYLQTKTLDSRQFARLDGTDKEQALTTGALVADKVSGVPVTQYRSANRQIKYTVEQDPMTVIDSLAKVKLYRRQGNQLDPELVTTTATSLRQKNQDRSVNLRSDRPRLKRLANQNRRALATNRQANRDGLAAMISDNQNQPVTYRLQTQQPQRTAKTELYLELSGINAQRLSMQDKYRGQAATNAYRNRAFTGIQRLNTLRRVLWNQSDGAYTVNVTSFQNFTGYSQLGQTNLSDYQPKHRVLLNLGYSKQPRKTIKVTFRGVKGLTFKSARLIAVPLGKAYTHRMQQLKHQKLRGLRVHNNRVTGTATAQQATVLTTSIPYSPGWHLTVDGQSVATQVVNVGFVGARLPAGTHTVKLTYRTPGLRAGLTLSAIGGLVIVGTLLGPRRWRKNDE